jgi:hypothetical protein
MYRNSGAREPAVTASATCRSTTSCASLASSRGGCPDRGWLAPSFYEGDVRRVPQQSSPTGVAMAARSGGGCAAPRARGHHSGPSGLPCLVECLARLARIATADRSEWPAPKMAWLSELRLLGRPELVSWRPAGIRGGGADPGPHLTSVAHPAPEKVTAGVLQHRPSPPAPCIRLRNSTPLFFLR